MPDQPGAGRLDPETLAAYVDGLLPPDQRAKVDAEIAADPEHYEWLANTVGAVDDDTIAGAAEDPSDAAGRVPRPKAGHNDTGTVLPFYRRRSVMGGAGVLLAAAASALLLVQLQPQWWQRLRGPQADPKFAKLVAAVGDERYIEPRLTGGFEYGPVRQVMRGPNDVPVQNLQVLAAAEELQQAADTDPSAENLHAWGVAQLLLGDPDLAVATLTTALAKEADEAVAIDLAAAYLAGGTLSDTSPVQDARARGRFAAALLAPAASARNPVAAFNYALALEQSGDIPAARRAWATALDLQVDPRWRHEVETRLQRLEQARP